MKRKESESMKTKPKEKKTGIGYQPQKVVAGVVVVGRLGWKRVLVLGEDR